MFAFPIKLSAALDMALEKNSHGNNAEKTNMGYGAPAAGNFARPSKTKVKTIIVMSGRKRAHPKPKIVCLYLTSKSRHAKK
jgi:hypothetical protein